MIKKIERERVKKRERYMEKERERYIDRERERRREIRRETEGPTLKPQDHGKLPEVCRSGYFLSESN